MLVPHLRRSPELGTVVRALGKAATGTVRWALTPPPESQAPAATSASPSAVRQ